MKNRNFYVVYFYRRFDNKTGFGTTEIFSEKAPSNYKDIIEIQKSIKSINEDFCEVIIISWRKY